MAWTSSRGILKGMDAPPGTGALSQRCPVCDGMPTILVGIRHSAMRRWTIGLLAADHGYWSAVEPAAGELLADAIARTQPDLVVVDSVDFPDCCRATLDALPPDRGIVIGPEPDRAYRCRALTDGARGWVCRDEIGEELSATMRTALGCRDALCLPSPTRQVLTGAPTFDEAPTLDCR